jgi:hypothetical protein
MSSTSGQGLAPWAAKSRRAPFALCPTPWADHSHSPAESAGRARPGCQRPRRVRASRRRRPSSPERGPGRKVAAWVRRGPGDDLVVALPDPRFRPLGPADRQAPHLDQRQPRAPAVRRAGREHEHQGASLDPDGLRLQVTRGHDRPGNAQPRRLLPPAARPPRGSVSTHGTSRRARSSGR